MLQRRSCTPFALAGLAAAAALLLPPGAFGTELRGRVVQVDGRAVRIAMDADTWPRVGDTVRLGQRIEGFDEPVFLRGEWTVTEVGPDSVGARPGADARGNPGRNFLAVIRSTNPQPRPGSGRVEGTEGKGVSEVSGGTGSGFEPIDLDQATALYERLLGLGDSRREDTFQRARDGDSAAQNQVGIWYLTGDGLPQDHEEAARWYRLAADQGNSAAMFNLGGLYENGRGVQQDLAEAARWYRRAADQGFAQAQRLLGYMHQIGHGVARDLPEAIRLYRLAAAQDYPDAHNDLGVLYSNGWGVQKDEVEAMRWFRSAAALGNHWGYFNMAEYYEGGRGLPPNHDLALRNYEAAARLGNTKAQEWLRSHGLGWS